MMIEMDHGVCGILLDQCDAGVPAYPVIQYALQLHGASRDGKPLPPLPAADSPANIENAQDYAGMFKVRERSLEFVAEAA